MKKYASTIIAVLTMTTLRASVDKDSLLGRPDYFYWLGSMDNFISCIEGDATRDNPPYHQRTRERWNDGWKLVFERADRVVVFMVTPVRKSACEVTFIQTVAYRPADYEEVEHGDPRKPAPPTIP